MNRKRRAVKRKGWWMNGFFPGLIYTAIAEFESLDDYLKNLSVFVSKEAKNFQTNIESTMLKGNFNPEESDAFFEAHRDEYEKLHSFFPNTLHYSVLAATCSLFESHLTRFCKYLEKEGRIEIPFGWEKCNKHKGIQKAAYFIRKNLEIYPEDNILWPQIKDHYTVRDCVVHAGGEISLLGEKKQKELLESLKRLKTMGVAKAENGFLFLSSSFMEKVVGDVKKWLKSFQQACVENNKIGPLYWP